LNARSGDPGESPIIWVNGLKGTCYSDISYRNKASRITVAEYITFNAKLEALMK